MMLQNSTLINIGSIHTKKECFIFLIKVKIKVIGIALSHYKINLNLTCLHNLVLLHLNFIDLFLL